MGNKNNNTQNIDVVINNIISNINNNVSISKALNYELDKNILSDVDDIIHIIDFNEDGNLNTQDLEYLINNIANPIIYIKIVKIICASIALYNDMQKQNLKDIVTNMLLTIALYKIASYNNRLNMNNDELKNIAIKLHYVISCCEYYNKTVIYYYDVMKKNISKCVFCNSTILNDKKDDLKNAIESDKNELKNTKILVQI
jgi:hypothetical protein